MASTICNGIPAILFSLWERE